jgi:hypothetical protein
VSPTDRHGKKQYRKPQLREYGDLRRLTESVPGQKGMPDAGLIGKLELKTAG